MVYQRLNASPGFGGNDKIIAVHPTIKPVESNTYSKTAPQSLISPSAFFDLKS